MRVILTSEEMREADAYTIQTLGVPSLTLMENAGRALAEVAKVLSKGGDILCLCGAGNNGGDGYACARFLKEDGFHVQCLAVEQPRSNDCKATAQAWQQAGGMTYLKFPASHKWALIVDCIFGTGFRGAFSDYALVEAIKNSGAKVLACDIPSGVNGDNGKVEDCAVLADVTLCLGEYKTGVYLQDGIDHAGQVLCADIGIKLPKENGEYAQMLTQADVRNLLPSRKRNTHKGSYGKAAIVAGSLAYSGAAHLSHTALFATAACLRTGVGYTTLYVPKNLLSACMLKTPEALLKSINDGDRYAFNEEKLQELTAYSAVAFGMGMGQSEDVQKGAAWLIANYQGKLILDADAINALALLPKERLQALFAQKKCDVLLTPHVKEFSRLSGLSVAEILQNGARAAQSFAKQNKATVLLKNAVTCIAHKNAVYVQTCGCSGQAKGGSGDVLAGVITGLAASGLSCVEAACVGSYLCGEAAEKAAEKLSEYAMLPSDIIAHLGAAFLSVLGQE